MHTTFQELNLLPSSGEGLSLERQFLFIYFFIVVLPWTGFEPANFFIRQFFGLLIRNANHYTMRGPRIVVNFSSTYVTRHNFFFFISGLIIGSHIGLMSMLGWLITWSVQWMNVDSVSFLILEPTLLCLLCPTGICFSVPMSVTLFWIYLFLHLLCSACVNLQQMGK